MEMDTIMQEMSAKPVKQKKKAIWIVLAVVLAALVIVGVAVWNGLCSSRYEAGVTQWEAGNYTQAARILDTAGGYKDAADYVDRYEQMLVEELTASSWMSEAFHYSNNTNDYSGYMKWEYVFDEGGVCRRLDHRNDDKTDGYEITGDYNATYEIVYTEDGVSIRIDTTVSVNDYPVTLTEDAEGVHVDSFFGLMQFHYDHYSTYTRQTAQ